MATKPECNVRANSLPVDRGRCLNLTWQDFCSLLRECWEQSTALANWCAVELERRDVVRLPGMKRLPKMPDLPKTRKGKKWLKGLYGLASVKFDFEGGFWRGNAICASSVCRAVERKHRRERKEIVWCGERRPARYRYPYPFPVHANCWDAELRDGRPVIVWKAPGGRRVELELRGGPEFGRQLAAFRRVANGEAKKCQMLITRQRCSESCHRQTAEGRRPGGGDRVSYRIMVKLVVEEPVKQAPGDRPLVLLTDPEALWVAELDGRRAWVENADHIKRALDWQEAHRVRLRRWAQDTKAERRCNKRKRRQFEESRRRCVEKHQRRMDSWCKELASHLTRFAVRQKVGHVLYQDIDKGNLPGMPWHKLKQALRDALTAAGIRLDCASDVEAA